MMMGLIDSDDDARGGGDESELETRVATRRSSGRRPSGFGFVRDERGEGSGRRGGMMTRWLYQVSDKYQDDGSEQRASLMMDGRA